MNSRLYITRPFYAPPHVLLFQCLFNAVAVWIYSGLDVCHTVWVLGRREERLSDVLLGWVLVALCFDIWIYMLGFGGIEIFWKQLEFFPRNIGYLLPPLVFFYLKSQFDNTFQFRVQARSSGVVVSSEHL